MMSLSKILFIISFIIVTNAYTLITGSKHDLSYIVYENIEDVKSDNSDLCVYCHTPHNAISEFSDVPLWSIQSDSINSYSMYGNATDNKFDNKIEEEINANPSKACLSCHDGVSAINSIANTSSMSDPTINIDDIVSGKSKSSNLGTISFDHPISVKFTGTGEIDSPASLRDINSKLGGNAEWITPDDTNNIRSLLRGPDSNMIECSSCHDPHLGQAKTFLRTTYNNKSNLCRGCHDK